MPDSRLATTITKEDIERMSKRLISNNVTGISEGLIKAIEAHEARYRPQLPLSPKVYVPTWSELNE